MNGSITDPDSRNAEKRASCEIGVCWHCNERGSLYPKEDIIAHGDFILRVWKCLSCNRLIHYDVPTITEELEHPVL